MRARKLMSVVLLSIMIICLVFVFVACEQEEGHKHEYSAEWTYDEYSHWHKATCEHTEEIKDKEEHSWGEGETVEEPTHNKEGLKKYTCSICSAVKEEILPQKHNYELKEEWEKDENYHWHELICVDCGDKKEHDKSEHSWDNGEIIEDATCSNTGIIKYTCKVCEQSKTENIPTIEHTYSTEGEITKPATCVEEGEFAYKCLNCEAVKTEIIPAMGHSYSTEGEITKPATCVEEGEFAHKCLNCEAVKTEIIPATGHSYSTEWSNDETYHWHASTCGHEVEKDKEEHSWDNYDTCEICNYDNSDGLKFEIYNYNTEYRVVGVKSNNKNSDIIIPSEYKGLQVTSIRGRVFSASTSLTSIEIPSSVISIDSDVFSWCLRLTIYCEAESAPSEWFNWNSSNRPVVWNCKNNDVANDGNIYYKAENGIKYSLKDGEARVVGQSTLISGSKEIPSEVTYKGKIYRVTSIGSYAFSDCSSLTSIEIPDSVTSIGNGAFSYCSSLTSIEIPSSITSIGSYAFEDCSSLTSIEIPDSVTSIDNRAFNGCSSLTSIEIPSSITSIGNQAFRDCSSLTSIEIPSSVTSIGDSAFSGCSSLTSIEIPSSITSIGESTFYGCISLVSIEIPNSVTSISSEAFEYCVSLTSIVIPSSVTSIESYAFRGCINLTIYCVAESQPSGWVSDWNFSNRPVVWGYKG